MSSDLDVHSALRDSLHELLSGGDHRDVRDWACDGCTPRRGEFIRCWRYTVRRRPGLGKRPAAVAAVLRWCIKGGWGGTKLGGQPLSRARLHKLRAAYSASER